MAAPRHVAAALSLVAGAALCRGKHMDCGSGVPLCGVLTLETGFGAGVYHHAHPHTHGLWPETGQFGSSQCLRPKDSEPPSKIYPCYEQKDTPEHLLWFERHEWEKHGECAGAASADDFFNQVCALSKGPLEVLEGVKAQGGDFQAMVDALRDKDYPVFSADSYEDQVLLSACAASDGRWVIAAVPEFHDKCGHGVPPSPGPAPPSPPPPSPAPPPPPGSACVPGRKGPKCGEDGDCEGLSGCIRCAHSGYCTDQPLLPGTLVHV